MSTGTVVPVVSRASLAPVILAMIVSPAWTFQYWELRMPPVQGLLPTGLARAPAPVPARAGVTRPAAASSARAPMTRQRRREALLFPIPPGDCGRREAEERPAPPASAA